MHTYVIALDQGTTSSRAVLFDENARIVAVKKGWKNTSGRRRGWCRMHIFPAAS